MTFRHIALAFAATLVVVDCGAAADGSQGIDEARASELISRNIFLREGQFPIDESQAHQYGNVHVDGPTGGMLYRFVTTSQAVDWLVARWQLERVSITSSDQLPLEFLDETPDWWRPKAANPSSYYVLEEDLPAGGQRRLIVVTDALSGVTYVVEHFSHLRGI